VILSGSRGEKVGRERRQLHNEYIINVYSSMNIFTVNIVRSEYGTLVGEMRKAYKNLVEETDGEKNTRKKENRPDLKEMGCVNVDWI
jgi:hypothetical protein